MELMVAMAITTIIVTVLVSITSIAMDTWNRSRSELRASRQAKAMIDTMARDFESMVTRRGNDSEWLSVVSSTSLPGGQLQSSNAAELIFLSSSADRYNGNIGASNSADKGGDVSCVGYRLSYRDPVGSGGNEFKTFVLNRILVNPDETFTTILGQKDLTTAFSSYSNKLDDEENFVCENVYQFSVTFQVEVTKNTGSAASPVYQVLMVPVTVGQSSTGHVTDSFKINGQGIDTSASSGSVTNDELKAGRVKAVEISLTVLSDAGIDQLRNRGFAGDQASEFIAKNGYQFSKLIQVPGM